jgi:hypothetical protein
VWDTDPHFLWRKQRGHNTCDKWRSWTLWTATVSQSRFFGHCKRWGQNSQHFSGLTSWWNVKMIVVKCFYNSLYFVYGCHWKGLVVVWSLVNTTVNHRVPLKTGYFLTSWAAISFSRRTLSHGPLPVVVGVLQQVNKFGLVNSTRCGNEILLGFEVLTTMSKLTHHPDDGGSKDL